MRRRAAPANSSRANKSRGLRAARFAARKRKMPFSGYPSPSWDILTPILPNAQHSGWYRSTPRWTGYTNIHGASTPQKEQIYQGRQTSKNSQKHVVGGGFSPKTRGRIVFTPVRFRDSSSMIFCRNLHTKIIPLAPWEPRNTRFSTVCSTINNRRRWCHVDSCEWAMFLTTCYHQPAGAGRF